MSGDIYQSITDHIVQAIEKNPGDVLLPWHRGGASGLPRNAHTGADYRGQNIVTLWCLGLQYPEPVWASYRQWAELGCQVRKGERGSPIIYYSSLEREDDDGKERSIPFIKHSAVFNASQVDGYQTPSETPEMPPLERLAHVDAFVVETGIPVIEGGSQAFYDRIADEVHMPDGVRFFDTTTSTRTESFYAVLSHELVHATGHPTRLFREMGGKYGDPRYAFEELVAELGSAFLCARLGITPEPREDHARYLQNWLSAFKGDKKFIFSAASQAQMAVDYLLQKGVPDDNDQQVGE